MKRLALTAVAAVGLLASLDARPALAQIPGLGRQGPALSPFLNLRRGGNPAANYFLGTLPELDRRATKAEQGAALLDLERRAEEASTGENPLSPQRDLRLPPSGHATYFGNTAGYFGQPTPRPATPAATPRTRGR